MQMNVQWEDESYSFDPDTDITVQRLRVLKAAFGPDYGKYITLMQLGAQGDADALVGLLWVMRIVNGKTGDPKNMPNFAAGKFYLAYMDGVTAALEEEESKSEEGSDGMDPTSGNGAASPGSTPTSTSSETSTSSPSPTSAT